MAERMEDEDLKRLMRVGDVTTTDLAREIGVSRPYLSMLLAGSRRWRPGQARECYAIVLPRAVEELGRAAAALARAPSATGGPDR